MYEKKIKHIVVGIVFFIVACFILMIVIVNKLNQSDYNGYEYAEGIVIDTEMKRKQPGKSVMLSYSATVKFTTNSGKDITFDTGYIFALDSQLDEPLMVRYKPNAIYTSPTVVKKDLFTGNYVSYEDGDNVKIMIMGFCILGGILSIAYLIKGSAKDILLGTGYIIAGLTTFIAFWGDDLLIVSVLIGGILFIAGIAIFESGIQDIKKAKKQKQTEILQTNDIN